MWRITVILNIFIMSFFWLAGRLAITPAYNHFIQYPETPGYIALPIMTKAAASVINVAVILPIIWIFVAFILYRFLRKQNPADRNEHLLAFTLITLCVGFLMLLFFGLAGILPFLQIGAAVL